MENTENYTAFLKACYLGIRRGAAETKSKADVSPRPSDLGN